MLMLCPEICVQAMRKGIPCQSDDSNSIDLGVWLLRIYGNTSCIGEILQAKEQNRLSMQKVRALLFVAEVAAVGTAGNV